MKLVYRGNYKGEEQLPKGDLPENAVPFVEPETPAKLNLTASLFAIPALLLCGVLTLCSVLIYGRFRFSMNHIWCPIGAFASLLTVLPHELLHGVCFGRNARVELYVSLKNLMAFVVSTEPVSKRRFIGLSLLPNLVFGWLPMLVWAFCPLGDAAASFLFAFSIMSVLLGVGDYMNVWNALRQMPKGSMQQLSGFHSYWYLPQGEGERRDG